MASLGPGKTSFKAFLTKLRQEWAEIPGVAN